MKNEQGLNLCASTFVKTSVNPNYAEIDDLSAVLFRLSFWLIMSAFLDASQWSVKRPTDVDVKAKTINLDKHYRVQTASGNQTN